MPWNVLRTLLVCFAAAVVVGLVGVSHHILWSGSLLATLFSAAGTFFAAQWFLFLLSNAWTSPILKWGLAASNLTMMLAAVFFGVLSFVDAGRTWGNATFVAFVVYLQAPLCGGFIAALYARYLEKIEYEQKRAAAEPCQFDEEVTSAPVAAFAASAGPPDFVHTPATGKVLKFTTVPRGDLESHGS